MVTFVDAAVENYSQWQPTVILNKRSENVAQSQTLVVPVEKSNFGNEYGWILAKAPWWQFVHSFKDMQSVIKILKCCGVA